MQIKRGRYLQNIYFSPNYESEVKEIEIIGILIIIKKKNNLTNIENKNIMKSNIIKIEDITIMIIIKGNIKMMKRKMKII